MAVQCEVVTLNVAPLFQSVSLFKHNPKHTDATVTFHKKIFSPPH